jgi:ABC-type antimicrobial peptide transport system permease subunit
MKGYTYLGHLFIAKRKVRFVFLLLSIVVGITSLFVLLALHYGVKDFLSSRAFSSIGVKEIIVKPQFQTGMLAGINKEEKKQITDQTVQDIQKIDGVESVYPNVVLKLPSSIRISAMGNTFESDAPVFGIAPEMVQGDLQDPSSFNANTNPVPIVLSKDIIEFYNAGFADSLNLPKLNDAYLTGTTYGKDITLMLGSSAFVGYNNPLALAVPARIVGFSSKVPLMGVSIPLQKVKEYSEQFHVGAGKINTLFVTVRDPSEVNRITSIIESMGYTTDSLQKRIQGVNDNIKVLSLVIGAISFIILFATAISLFNAFYSDVVESTPVIGLLRSVGGTKWFIARLFLSKAVLISFLGGLIGTFLGFYIVQVVNKVLLEQLPAFLAFHISIATTPWFLILFTILFSVLFGLVATIYPAYYAARLDPVEALRH